LSWPQRPQLLSLNTSLLSHLRFATPLSLLCLAELTSLHVITGTPGTAPGTGSGSAPGTPVSSGGTAFDRLESTTEVNPNPETRSPKPETRNLKPETRTPNPDTRNSDPYTRNPKMESTIEVGREPYDEICYRGTSPKRKRTPLGPYRRPMPRVLGGF
jgi:hypothetical protein